MGLAGDLMERVPSAIPRHPTNAGVRRAADDRKEGKPRDGGGVCVSARSARLQRSAKGLVGRGFGLLTW